MKFWKKNENLEQMKFRLKNEILIKKMKFWSTKKKWNYDKKWNKDKKNAILIKKWNFDKKNENLEQMKFRLKNEILIKEMKFCSTKKWNYDKKMKLR